ncbi:MAG: methyltransferase [Chitinophagales bacterium]|nr:methyltransferase [Bacteroidota bacterium]
MSVFHFKKFSIQQGETAMKVGTDGVLLGAWVDGALIGDRVLDIGTGTGIIAIMLAQKNPEAQIYAIERDENAFQQATGNVAICPWSNNIHVYHIDLAQYLLSSSNAYSTIVCNPPYFIKGWQVDNPGRKLARDAEHLPHDLLIAAAKQLLTVDGNLWIVLPKQEGELFITTALQGELYCCNKTQVFTKPGIAAKRLLLRFSNQKTVVEENELLIADEQNNYTDAYKALTKDFYLNF